MKLTATELRSDLYKVLDRVAETGEPVEIERKGKRLKIVVDEPAKPKVFRWENLKGRPDAIVGDGDISDIDWSNEWNPPEGNGSGK